MKQITLGTASSLKLALEMQNLLLGLSSRKLAFVSWLELASGQSGVV
jgi:hypothetical protein